MPETRGAMDSPISYHTDGMPIGAQEVQKHTFQAARQEALCLGSAQQDLGPPGGVEHCSCSGCRQKYHSGGARQCECCIIPGLVMETQLQL